MMNYSNEKLLQYAFTMLRAAKEGSRGSKPVEWLKNNQTMDIIEQRVKEIAERKFDNVPPYNSKK